MDRRFHARLLHLARECRLAGRFQDCADYIAGAHDLRVHGNQYANACARVQGPPYSTRSQ
jgi:hypothetical protein